MTQSPTQSYEARGAPGRPLGQHRRHRGKMIRIQGVTQSEDETKPENGEIRGIRHAAPRTIRPRHSHGQAPMTLGLVASSASCMHLEMRILAQAINADQPAFAQSGALQGFAFFCAAVTTQFPAALNERPHLAGRNAITERFP